MKYDAGIGTTERLTIVMQMRYEGAAK